VLAFDGHLCVGFTNSKWTRKRGIRNIWNEMEKYTRFVFEEENR